jgi:four helix bundle protein
MASSLRYRSLVAWQRADDLFIRMHQLSRQAFPAGERYCLTSQLRRAALSVPANHR